MNQNPYSVGNNLDLPSNELQGSNFEGSVRGMQIVAGALMAGILFLLATVLVLTQGDIFNFQQPKVSDIIIVAFGFLMIIIRFVIPRFIASTRLNQIAINGFVEVDEAARVEMILGVYRSQLIISFALLEGAATFNLIGLINAKCVSLFVPSLALGLMALKFPTRDKVSFWVQDKLRELQLM